jgi:hypothetical protein
MRMSDSDPTYQDIFAPDYTVTGIRQNDDEAFPVVITGSYQQNDKPQALLYRGPLVPTDATGYCYLSPHFTGLPRVVSSVFYGPNTPLFDRALGKGNVRAVGSCKFEGGSPDDHGMMYEGDFDGRGTWTLLDVPDDVAGAAVGNTLAHSTMGDLVVGNYDLAGSPGSGNGFIYSISQQRFSVLKISQFATLYGVWQNGGENSTSYTLAGGYDAGQGLNQGLLLDYDAASGNVGEPVAYSFDNMSGLLTHFEGITLLSGTANYALAAMWDKAAGGVPAFAVIPRNNGKFGAARWIDISPSDDSLYTANSVLENNVIGIYPTGTGVQSYVTAVPLQQADRGALGASQGRYNERARALPADSLVE